MDSPDPMLAFVMHSRCAIGHLKCCVRGAEGVGFEPTVGFPTLDFESSALNRTQPPFLEKNAEPAYAKSFGVASVERATSYIARKCGAENGVSMRVWSSAFRRRPWRAIRGRVNAELRTTADRIVCFTRQKNVTI